MHLEVCDVLCNNSYQFLQVKSDDEDDEDSDEEDHSSPPALCGDVYDLENKIRTVVRILRKSLVRSDDVLQRKIRGKELKLLFDCKTR